MTSNNWSRSKLKLIPLGKVKDPILWRWVKASVPKKVDTSKLPYKMAHIDGADIWLVDAEKVRRDKFMDFNYGGHDLIYGQGNPEYKKLSFIPSGQIWLDGLMTYSDLISTLYHEIIERRHMARGMSYDKAHGLANKGNKAFDSRPNRPGRGYPTK